MEGTSSSQAQYWVTQGDCEVDTILQVQKAAPMDLLLGTDVLSQLGFVLIQAEQRHSDDLLCHSPDTPKNLLPAQETATELNQASSLSGLILPTSYQKTNSAPVRLIEAVRLPGQYSKLIQAAVCRMVRALRQHSFSSLTGVFWRQEA